MPLPSTCAQDVSTQRGNQPANTMPQADCAVRRGYKAHQEVGGDDTRVVSAGRLRSGGSGGGGGGPKARRPRWEATVPRCSNAFARRRRLRGRRRLANRLAGWRAHGRATARAHGAEHGVGNLGKSSDALRRAQRAVPTSCYTPRSTWPSEASHGVGREGLCAKPCAALSPRAKGHVHARVNTRFSPKAPFVSSVWVSLIRSVIAAIVDAPFSHTPPLQKLKSAHHACAPQLP